MGVLVNQAGQKVAWPTNNEPLTLGAGPDCRVLRTPQGAVARDAGSPNGFLINGQKVREHVLRPGDVIQVGQNKYTYTETAAPAPATAGTAGRSTDRMVKPTAAAPAPQA